MSRKKDMKAFLNEFDTVARTRIESFERLLEHVRAGFSTDCFEDFSSEQVFKNFEKWPEEYSKEAFEQALRQGKASWELIGKNQALGTCLGNSRSWFYNMAQRYGWSDKVDVRAEHAGNVNVSIVSYASTQCSS